MVLSSPGKGTPVQEAGGIVHGAQTVDGEVPAEEASGMHAQSNDTQTTNSINIQ